MKFLIVTYCSTVGGVTTAGRVQKAARVTSIAICSHSNTLQSIVTVVARDEVSDIHILQDSL